MDLQMSDDNIEKVENEIVELANKVLAIEREVRSDKSGNRTVIVGKILALLNEVTKDDNQ